MLNGIGTLDSAVTPGAYGAKNFLLRDGKESLPCVFYEIVSILCLYMTQTSLAIIPFMKLIICCSDKTENYCVKGKLYAYTILFPKWSRAIIQTLFRHPQNSSSAKKVGLSVQLLSN